MLAAVDRACERQAVSYAKRNSSTGYALGGRAQGLVLRRERQG